MNKPKEYQLNIGDILQIPDDSFDNFLIDLKKWHGAVRSTIDMLEVIAKATNQPMPTELVTMKWIDDGKHNGKVIIQSAQTNLTVNKE